jgi:hypothetical protein
MNIGFPWLPPSYPLFSHWYLWLVKVTLNSMLLLCLGPMIEYRNQPLTRRLKNDAGLYHQVDQHSRDIHQRMDDHKVGQKRGANLENKTCEEGKR